MYIDADAHVDENDETWSYFPKNMAHIRPAEMTFGEGKATPYLVGGYGDGQTWRGLFIDGHIYYRRTRNDELTQTTADTRELYDVPARLKQMDELGVEAQILYPSILLDELTPRPEVEIALCEAYNRWIADRCRDSGGRLQWTALLPLRSMPDALRELERVKEEGAVGIFKRGYESDNRRAGEPYFHPLYAAAQDLDIPICVHISGPYVGVQMSKTQHRMEASLYLQDAFLSLSQGTFKKFPRLRFGFIEAGSGWVANALFKANFDRITKFDVNAEAKAARNSGEIPKKKAPVPNYAEILHEHQIYVTCEAGENLPATIADLGDDRLCVGTDYGHADRSSFVYAHGEVASYSDLSAESIERLTAANGRAFYNLA
jgi:predicted TIM-barrel fold metal-dependent hydrolase